MQPTSLGQYKGIDITPGDSASVAAQMAKIDAPQSPAPATPTATPAATPTAPVAVATPASSVKRSIYDAPANTPAVKTADQIQQEMMQGAQGQINSLSAYYGDLLKDQAVVNDKNNRSTASISTLTGLAGSSEANVQQEKTTAVGEQANKAIKNENEMKVQELMGNIRQSAIDEARSQREEARLNEADRIKSVQARQQEAVTNLTNLSATGVTFDGLKAGDPEGFSYLSKQFGGDEALRGAMILNTPKDQIIDKKLENGKYIVAKQNPITGKVTVETLETGIPAGYTKTIDAGNRILAVPDDWDGDPAKLITINKGLTPAQAAKGAGGAGGSGGGAYATDLDAIIGTTLSGIPTKFGQATFSDQMKRARSDADKINLVASTVLKGSSSDTKKDFAQQAIGISNIDKAIKMIDEGTQTGALNSAAQYVFNLAGKDYDPKLAKLNTYIVSAIQPYRNSVTGAAWGPQEQAEYDAAFGSTKYSPAELKQRLQTIKEVLKDKSVQGLNAYVNPLGLNENVFNTGSMSSQSGGTSGSTPSQVNYGGGYQKQVEYGGKIYNVDANGEMTPA